MTSAKVPAELRALRRLQNGTWRDLPPAAHNNIVNLLTDMTDIAWGNVRVSTYLERMPSINDPAHRALLESLHRKFVKLNISTTGLPQNLVDLGAGTGRDAAFFATRGLGWEGYNVTALERSWAFYNYMRHAVYTRQLQVHQVANADIRHTRLPTASQDIAFSMAVLQNLPYLPGSPYGAEAAVAEMARITRRGGLCFISTLEGNGCEAAPTRATGDAPVFWQFYTSEQLVGLLARHGFAVIEATSTASVSDARKADPTRTYRPWLHILARRV